MLQVSCCIVKNKLNNMEDKKFILTEIQKATLELYLYCHKDYGLVFEFLEKIGVHRDDYNEIFKQLKHEQN